MLTLKINNIHTDIVGSVSPEDLKAIERKLSFRPEGYQFSAAFNRWIYNKNGEKVRRQWDGWQRQFWSGKKRTYFPTGLISLVTEYLTSKSIPYQRIDERVKPEQTLNLSFVDGFSLRDYQEEMVDAAYKKTRGLIQAPTGAGKTPMAAGLMERLKVAPFLFFVTSIDLLTQAKESLEEILLLDGKPIKIGQIGGGIVDIREINVITVQTAVRSLGGDWSKNYKFDDDDEECEDTVADKYRQDILNLLHSAKGSTGDEIQHWRAETCRLVSQELTNCYYTYGISATPFRDSGDDMLIQACFGRVAAQITASELIRKGWLIRPDIKVIHIQNKKSIFKQWQSIYKEQIVENAEYNGMIAKLANAYIKNDRYILVLTKQVSHGKKLASMIPGAVFLSGNSPKKQRESGLQQLREKKISCIVSTVIFDEGINVQCLDTVILAGQGKSKVRAMQRIGRIMRTYEGKTRATAIDFCIYQKYLKDHAMARIKMYKTEPEYNIEDIFP